MKLNKNVTNENDCYFLIDYSHQFRKLWLDGGIEDVPPLLQVILGVSFQRSGYRLTVGIELDMPRLRHADEVNDLDLVTVAVSNVSLLILKMCQTWTDCLLKSKFHKIFLEN